MIDVLFLSIDCGRLGMMVGGELVAEGSASSADGAVVFSLAAPSTPAAAANAADDADAVVAAPPEPPPVRLVGGASASEGRLQVRSKTV